MISSSVTVRISDDVVGFGILSVPGNFRIAGILSLGVKDSEPKPHSLDEIDKGKIHLV